MEAGFARIVNCTPAGTPALPGLPASYSRQPPKTPNSALRSLDKMLIYLYVNSAFVSVASLDFGVFGGCLKLLVRTPALPGPMHKFYAKRYESPFFQYVNPVKNPDFPQFSTKFVDIITEHIFH